MSFADTLAFQAFWSQSWSAPLRASCRWLQRIPGPVVPPLPDALAPGWLRPLWLQRRLAQAVQARLAWRKAHPRAQTYWAEAWTTPSWSADAWTPYTARWLHDYHLHEVARRFEIELERLVRLMEIPPRLMGEERWTHAVLGTCERLAQLYHDLLRRCGRRGTRRFVERTLAWCITYEQPPDPTPAPSAPDAAPASALASVPALPITV